MRDRGLSRISLEDNVGKSNYIDPMNPYGCYDVSVACRPHASFLGNTVAERVCSVPHAANLSHRSKK